MNIPLRCRCGELEGHLASPETALRAVCYCRDCRAFARFLGDPAGLLDAAGGSDIIATQPRHVRITRGVERLACMSLGPRGLCRWYASCCRTPIANTPRNPRVSYAGVPVACLAAPPEALDKAFGPPRIHIRAQSATGPVEATPMLALRGGLSIMRNILRARLSGAWRENPFFREGTEKPLAAPRVLAPRVRAMLTG